VHLFLAESCDDALPGMLLDVWTWWDGSLSHPGRPRNYPNFPAGGAELRYPTLRMKYPNASMTTWLLPALAL
jgi:hypothetical protein